MRIDRWNDDQSASTRYISCDRFVVKPWSVRLSVEEGNDFNSLNRVGGRLFVDTTSRFSLQSNWNYFRKSLGSGGHDDALMGDTNLVYRFAQNEYAQFRAGLGFRVWADDSDTRWGVNVMYGADFFPVKSFVISALIDGGNLGSAGVFHARATAGAVFRGWELFGGYDYLPHWLGQLAGADARSSPLVLS